MGAVLQSALEAYANIMVFFAGGEFGAVAKGAAVVARELTKQEAKSIGSLEVQISKHEKKLVEFQSNPTARLGMENFPADVIRRQQQTRINHLLTEIQTFRNNIQNILGGE